jgi:hypothetical protein
MNDAACHESHGNLNARQRAIGRHIGGRSLRRAVRLAAFAFFRFTHSSSSGEALWSETQRVWLGKKTYMHWAMSDPEIDIPRTVATAANVPAAPETLRRIVRGELNRYWTDKLSSLPRREAPGWMPLP